MRHQLGATPLQNVARSRAIVAAVSYRGCGNDVQSHTLSNAAVLQLSPKHSAHCSLCAACKYAFEDMPCARIAKVGRWLKDCVYFNVTVLDLATRKSGTCAHIVNPTNS
jgi:hypothetical protein